MTNVCPVDGRGVLKKNRAVQALACARPGMAGMARKLLQPVSLALLLMTGTAHAATDATCDRDCMKQLVNETLVSMVRHDPSTLPVSKVYRLTVNNVGSGLAMATTWRTITGFTPSPASQVVIDVPQQEVFFVATVQEGKLPALLWARLKVEDRKISELEIYLGRSRADSGMQFAPDDLAHLPPEWSARVPRSELPTREELTKIGLATFEKGVLGHDIPGNGTCRLVENGTVVKDWPLLSYLGVPGMPSQEEALRQGESTIPCGGISKESTTPMGSIPLYDKTRLIIDEEQGTVVSLGLVPGKALPNFNAPPPGPNPDYPTAFVPDSFARDQGIRAARREKEVAAARGPVPAPVPEVLATVEMHRIYSGRNQAVHRLMQALPMGSTSPWDQD